MHHTGSQITGTFMEKIAIQLEETSGFNRISEPVCLGIPLPTGTAKTVQNLTLMDNQKALAVQLEPLAHWPDGSIRWLHASFLISLAPHSKKSLILAQQKAPCPAAPKPDSKLSPQSLTIPTSTGSVVLQEGSLAWQAYNHNEQCVPSAVTLCDDTGTPCTVKADANWEITHEGAVFVAAKLKGQWLKQNNEPLARFECELRVFLETGLIQVELVTHNPKRARHPGGLWDLGDPGSVYFRELALETTLPAASTATITPLALDETPGEFHLADFNLYQDSSGGENWQSRNHVDANGDVTTRFCGYKLTTSSELKHQGKRANPLVSVGEDCGQLSMTVPGFWQNFPTSLRKEGNKLTIGLFPRDAKKAYELQGGERKTLRCLIDHHSNNSIAATAYAPLVPVLAPECYEQAQAFPWFKANTQPDALDELIAQGLDGESNFFAKREVIDEFGWRSFGDIFADHETLYQNEGEPPFVSHYNNQYDPIYGFARQFALTGNKRWFELMDDLARHVTDIDIYHTEEDRAEYNNGLFWHTDHYLDVHTATHRTFSKHNTTSSTPGQTGGGPGAEHCYTTGLLYHYWMTGNEDSAEAVLDLANWMRNSFENKGGLLAQLLALKKQELPNLKALARGQAPLAHRYPFTRATGNYLNTLLDAWLLTGDQQWRDQAEAVIRQSIHPNDEPDERNLLDVETGWSYLVLLISITRYLLIKAQHQEQDQNSQYARHALIRYTQWMQNHEQPFLAQTDQLEFPNHTWVAQDIRKAMLLCIASHLDPEQAEDYLQQANIWLEEIQDTLKNSPEAHFTRIVVILMQNQVPQQPIANPDLAADTNALSPAVANANTRLTWTTLMNRILRRAIIALLAFRPAKEKAWLQARLDR
ncbi:hypothetical protein [Marinobacter sp. S6332]|uniref:RIFT barrel domain-containing protein n=1 Tax=Marinobacter sp. S6332 TaxID=2926403 RepID=UPI001FF34552|nr:hypothetical protein [Marinobacter sp. S6332]MCK0163992.1 hypothetical protein [Marinobacter sp. S6332]